MFDEEFFGYVTRVRELNFVSYEEEEKKEMPPKASGCPHPYHTATEEEDKKRHYVRCCNISLANFFYFTFIYFYLLLYLSVLGLFQRLCVVVIFLCIICMYVPCLGVCACCWCFGVWGWV